MPSVTRERERERERETAASSNFKDLPLNDSLNKTPKEYLQNPTFYDRYIKINAMEVNAFNSSFGFYVRHTNPNTNKALKLFTKILRKCLSIKIFKTSLLEKYFISRLKNNKIDLPHIELALTTKCTLNCKHCANMMQYFDAKTHLTDELEGIKQSVTNLLACVDSISSVIVLGGEPLLFKQLPELIDFLGEQDKIKSVQITTNATIKFSDELIKSLKKHKKSFIFISDYSNSPSVKTKIYKSEIVSELNKHKILHYLRWQDSEWSDMGDIKKRNRDRAEIIKNLQSCGIRCVSITDGKMFVCPVANSLAALKGIDEFEGEFLRLDENLTRQKVLDFYDNVFYNACDYCENMWEKRPSITVAEQLKGKLSVD